MDWMTHREDTLYTINSARIGANARSGIQESVELNGAVGSLVGYYDDDLTVLAISGYLLFNLGYSREEYDRIVGQPLGRIFYGKNNTFLEWERFRSIRGFGEGKMLTKDLVPLNVRMYKEDSVDEQGRPIWILSVRADWERQNLMLVNSAIGSGLWYFDCDEAGNISQVNWSHDFRSLLGYHDILDFPDELESWAGLLHPDDRDDTLERLYSAIADRTDQQKFESDFRMKTAEGGYQWFRAKAAVTRRLDGTARRIAGIFVNINQEKQAAMREKRAEAFHNAYTKANICEYYLDLKENSFESMKVEGSLLEIFEQSDTWDELIQAFLKHFVCDADKAAVAAFYDRDYIAAALKERNAEVSLECHIMLNGEDHWVRNVVMPGAQDGENRYAIVFLRDITQAKKQEENLRMLIQDKAAIEQLVQGLVRLVDRFSVYNLVEDYFDFFNIQTANPIPDRWRYADFIHFVEENYKTLPPMEPVGVLFGAENLRRNIKSGDDIYKFEYCSKDERIYKSTSIVPLAWRGDELEKVLMISQDVSKEKMDEIASREALKEAYLAAERANRAKTEFLSNMSHDIRTPMNAIVGMTAIAGANIDNQERVVECLGKITQSSRHLLGLINEVLDMARIESGKVDLAEEEFNLSDLIENMVTMAKPGIEEHHHEFDIRVLHLEHEDVCGDSLRIQQIFTNLMSNAIKYTPDGGKITFTITEKPDPRSNLGCYQFTVEDNGIGMTPEFQKILFAPFTRADDHRTTNVQGTGLGMAITQNIVNMMNGNIAVDSELGRGTTFTVTVYLKIQDKKADQLQELMNLPVLVVDDDRECCESTVSILDEIGMNGEWVTSGSEAVRLITERHASNDDYFAVIVDWKMPGMDGIETTRRIRQSVGRDITIIILTAYDYSEVEEEARKAGVDMFIAKPLFRSRLTTKFKELLGGAAVKPATGYLEGLSHADFSGRRVLLAEDNDLNREIATEILKMTGAAVNCAVNGKQAVEMMTASPVGFYDLILMDIQMPVMNGYEATAAIRSLEREDRGLPIIAMTANAFVEDVQMAKNTGMSEHIAKPLDMDRLCAILNRYLKKP